MLKIGLTGGIGSGKSTVAGLFSALGVPVIDADHIARSIVEPGQPALEELVAAFGDDILHADGSLNRQALALRVFPDPALVEVLNSITHPRIRAEVAQQFAVAENRGEPVVIFDMPLLVESGYASEMDMVVVVDVAKEERIRRLVSSRGLSEEDARARIAAQVGDDVRREAADYVIDNNGDLAELRSQVLAIWEQIKNLI